MTENIFELNEVKFYYGERAALDIEDLRIKKGAVIGLTGPNGSGKSTLLELLAFLQKPSCGNIKYMGEDTAGNEQKLRMQVTLLLQEPFLLKRTVYENVAYGLRVRGDVAGIDDRINEALAMVGLDGCDFASRLWYELSGGEAQRVSLASRIVLRPQALLLDEPSGGADEKSAALIKAALKEISVNWGTTIIIATHDLMWLEGLACETLSLYRGKLIPDCKLNFLCPVSNLRQISRPVPIGEQQREAHAKKRRQLPAAGV